MDLLFGALYRWRLARDILGCVAFLFDCAHSPLCEEVLKVGWILSCSVLGLCAVGCYVHTYMHTYMHLGSWIFCVGSYLYSYAVIIDVVNIGSFLHHVGSYQSHCIGIGSFIVAAWCCVFLKCRMFRMK